MTLAQALIAFCIAAGLLTVAPGLDTALVLRTPAAEGPKGARARQPRRLDRLTGLVFLGLGVKLALVRRP